MEGYTAKDQRSHGEGGEEGGRQGGREERRCGRKDGYENE